MKPQVGIYRLLSLDSYFSFSYWLVADLGTSCAFVHLASVLRRHQLQDDEENIAIDMPKVIRPPFTATESDETCLISRRHDIANLPGSIFFWGTMLLSSTSTNVYSGALLSVVNVICHTLIPSDPFVPIFLLPTLLTVQGQESANNCCTDPLGNTLLLHGDSTTNQSRDSDILHTQH